MIEVALRTLIMANAAQAGPRVMPVTEVGTLSEGLPKIAYTLINAPKLMTDHGPVRLTTARYQIDIFAKTLVQARTIATQLETGLDGFKGTVNETEILLVRFDDERFLPTKPTTGADFAAARFQQDVFISYRG